MRRAVGGKVKSPPAGAVLSFRRSAFGDIMAAPEETHMTMDRIEGRCLCGAVKVRMTPPEAHIDACHCGMCRRWGGGPFLSLGMVTDPEIEGKEHIARYASSDWAERAFCRACGTHLFYYYQPEGGYSFAAGLFDAANGFEFAQEIFIDDKPGYYDFAGQRERLTGQEVMAKFGVDGSDESSG